MPVGTLRRWIAFWYNLPARVATRIWVGGEVNYAMKYNFEVLSRQYAVVALFVRHLAYARGLKAATENLKDHGEFGGSTASAHLELAVVEWCKVFGSDGEKTHWKKMLTCQQCVRMTAERARTHSSETRRTLTVDFHSISGDTLSELVLLDSPHLGDKPPNRTNASTAPLGHFAD